MVPMVARLRILVSCLLVVAYLGGSGTTNAPVRAQAQQPVDDVAQWISAHPRVMMTLGNPALGIKREFLTPSARRCIDNLGGEAAPNNSIPDIDRCARMGAAEIHTRQEAEVAAAVARLTAATLKSDGDAPKAQWASDHPRIMRVWDQQRYRREFLTPSARRCIDESGGESGLHDMNALILCAKRGTREVLSQRIAERQHEYERGLVEATVKWMGAVFGAEVVFAEDSREEAKAEIAKQKKYSRYGGVISKTEMYASQQKIRASDEEIDRMKGLAEEAQIKILGRTDEQTREASACILEHASHVDETLRAVHSFAVEGQDCLWMLILHLELEDGETLRNWTNSIFTLPPGLAE